MSHYARNPKVSGYGGHRAHELKCLDKECTNVIFGYNTSAQVAGSRKYCSRSCAGKNRPHPQYNIHNIEMKKAKYKRDERYLFHRIPTVEG